MPSPKLLEPAARLGFAARGVLYMAVGYLTLRLGRTSDNGDALSFIEGAGGRIVLAIMALGFLAYGLWRLSEAAIDSEGHGSDAKGVAKRVGGAVSGVVHLALALVAVRLITGTGGGGGDVAERGASAALSFPGGAAALLLVAAVLLGVGVYQLVSAVKLGFLKHLDPQAARQPWAAWVGRAGYLARGTVFVLVALFTWRAGRESQSSQAGGTEQALDAMPEWLRLLVAAGFVMFGIFSLVEARYRRINDPDVLARLRRTVA
ncbi:MAG TPA: DUF1206 domain-containing protein [Sphingomonas sp.]|uniref:DUF1206 domain-containing protein n=1 Tax=Sphingomonas sp. TaxID=28214 RepID=UPI002EDB0313